jgi:hypothetical protein
LAVTFVSVNVAPVATVPLNVTFAFRLRDPKFLPLIWIVAPPAPLLALRLVIDGVSGELSPITQASQT